METRFKDYSDKVRAQFAEMCKTGKLFVVCLSKDEVWDAYTAAFPVGTNEQFRERPKHDCNCCRHFVKNVGNVVAIKDNKYITVWDTIDESDAEYAVVGKALRELILSKPIRQIFKTGEARYGTPTSIEVLPSGTAHVWEHFSCSIPAFAQSNGAGALIGQANGNKQVFERGLEELTSSSIATVLELIAQDSLYRGAEQLSVINGFKALQSQYNALPIPERDAFTWENMDKTGARIRASAIGSLLIDLDGGMELEKAVKSFEVKVAPSNYKRPTALITPSMVASAQKTIDGLGIADALPRRHAKIDDVSVNDVLFVDRQVKPLMKDSGLAGIVGTAVKKAQPNFNKVEEISIDKFLNEVLPSIESLEVYFENKHKQNLVTLVAPVNPEAKSILKWDNNFTWSYVNNLTDTMKENVKSAGGSVDGLLRFSIQWNDANDNPNDLDAHCILPSGGEIYYGNKSMGGGTLDVDIINPASKVAVENIIFTGLKYGDYKFSVRTFSNRGGRNFSAQVEFDGQIFDFSYQGACNKHFDVAVVNYSKEGFKIVKLMGGTSSPHQEHWGISTNNFVKVNSVVLSPNYWGDTGTGNKHFMFMLNGCLNPDPVRGFFNEFLSNDLQVHKKVFEVVGSKMLAEYTPYQLSGIGFSSTLRNELIVKVNGAFNRMLKIKF